MKPRLAIALLLLFCTALQNVRVQQQLVLGPMDCCSETNAAHGSDNSAENIPCHDPNAACCLTNACFQASILVPGLGDFTKTLLLAGTALPISDLYYGQRPLLLGILRPPIA